MKKILFFLSILLSISAHAQNCAEKIKAAKASTVAGNYRLALSQFSAAASDCGPERSAEIQREILGIYDKIEALKKQADDAKAAALRNLETGKKATEAALAAEKKTSETLLLVEQQRETALAEKEKAETAKQLALIEKEKAQTAEKKTTAVLNKIYFYTEEFGLAYDQSSNLYGFIDKNLKTKIVFKYTEALPFQYIGFAKVKRDNQYFLIDTLGKEYPLATELDQLSPEITALDLRLKKLTKIPSAVKKSVNLKILLLGSNQLTSVAGLEKLTNLIELDLFGNQLTSVAGLEKLTNLTRLDLRYNQLASVAGLEKLTNLSWVALNYMKLSKKEIAALREALPTWKIFVSEELLID